MKKNILHIIVGLGNGGAENTLFKLTKSLKKKYNFSILVLGKQNSIEWKFKESNIKLIKLDLENKFFIFFELYKIYKIIQKINPDLIQSWMYHSDFIASVIGKFFLKKKVVWCIRHSNLKLFKSKITTIILAKVCAILSNKLTDEIIYSSKESEKYHKIIGYDKLKGIAVFNGYDPKKLSYINFKKRNKIHLGFLANYRPQKDFKTFLEALSIIKKKNVLFKCYMAGQNVNIRNKELKILINYFDLNNDIILMGELSNTKIFFKKIDFLVSSSCFGESFPNVLAESMLQGIPCISTEVGYAKKIINKLGWTCVISRSDKLAQNIIKAIKFKEVNINQYKRLKMSVRASIINRFHIDIMSKKYSFLWQKVIN